MRRLLLLAVSVCVWSVSGDAQVQSLTYGVALPPVPDAISGTPSFTSCTIDAVDEECAHIFVASTTKAIDKIHFLATTVTTGATIDMRVEGVDATDGDPDDTLIATNTNASVVIADGDDNTWKTATLAADANITKGSVYALVLKGPGSGTPNFNIAGFTEENAEGMPYRDFFSSTWTKVTNSQAIFLIEFTDGTFEPQLGLSGAGLNVGTVVSFNTGTTTTRECNELTLPFATRVSGAWGLVDGDGAFTLELRDSAGSSTLATSAAQDPDIRTSGTAGVYYLPFTATYTTSANTTYQVCAVPSTTTSIGVYRFTLPSAAAMGSFAGGTVLYRSNNDSGDITTDRVLMGVFLDGFASGGGRRRIIGG